MSAAATTEPTTLPRSPSLPTFFDNLDSFAEAPEGVAKLREFILDLAVRGKLVEQDENDEPASELLDEVANESASREVSAEDQPYALPSSWAWSPLGAIADILMGNSPPGSSYNDSGEGKPLINGPVEFSPGPFGKTIKSKFTTEPTKMCKTGDLLICVRGSTTGRTNIAAFDACIGRGVASIRSRIHSPYLNYVILSMRDSIYESGTGSTFKSISQKQLFAYPIPLPPLSEQRRIVSKVGGLMSLCDELESRGRERVRLRERASRSCLDRLVSSRSRRDLSSAWQRLSDHFEVLYDTPETLAHLRQSILQLAVQGKLVLQDPNDEPTSEFSMEELVGRKNLKNGLSLKQTTTETPYRCLQLSALRDGVVDCSGGKPVPLSAEKAEPYLIRQGDVFIVRGNGSKDLVGRAGIVNSQPRNVIFPDLFIRSPLDTKRLLPRYFLIAWNSPQMRTRIENAAKTTSGIWKVNQGHIASMTVRVPPLAEQKRIVAKVDQLLSQCDELSARLRERQSATHGLLTATIHHILADTPA